MTKKIAFIQLEIEIRVYPLVPAYLSGYARLDQEINEYWKFITVTNPYDISPAGLVSEMNKVNADVYAFSCYSWNMGLIKQVIYNYLDDRPDVHIILGGPQVANQLDKYLDKKYENLVICNGEGEKIFRNYLKELMNETPDFNKIRGLSFYLNGSPVTTSAEERIKDLDEIPSPFSSELFNKGDYRGVMIEASRGCPFRCPYCSWGGQGSKPAKFSTKRVMADIKQIAEKNIHALQLLDSNFGFFSRDVELAGFIVQCKNEYKAFANVFFSPYIKNIDRIFEISKLFHDAKISTSCELAFQTMNELAIKRINRKINDNEKLIPLISELNKAGINSYAELIWPLPGETLDSYKKGIGRLCGKNANIISPYTLVLLNNILFQNQREEYGLITRFSKNSNRESEIVVQTNEVSIEDFYEGIKFAYTVQILYNMRSLYITAGYLNSFGIEKYKDLFSNFKDFIISNMDFPAFSLIKDIMKEKRLDQYLIANAAYEIDHEKRDLFDKQLYAFASSQSWWNNENARLCFETDLLNRGYLFSGQEKEKNFNFQHVKILETLTDGYLVEIPSFLSNLLKDLLCTKADFSQHKDNAPDTLKSRLYINHNQSQKEFDSNDSQDKIFSYCNKLIYFTSDYLPIWQEHN